MEISIKKIIWLGSFAALNIIGFINQDCLLGRNELINLVNEKQDAVYTPHLAEHKVLFPENVTGILSGKTNSGQLAEYKTLIDQPTDESVK